MRILHPFFFPHFVLCSSFVVSILIAAVIANDANRRGMSGLLWGVGVFLLCIVFLPLYLVVRRPIPTPAPVTYATNAPPPPSAGASMKYCNQCGTSLPQDAHFCANCGATQQG